MKQSQDKKLIERTLKLLQEADNIYNAISPEKREEIHGNYHEKTSPAYCFRWCMQALEETLKN